MNQNLIFFSVGRGGGGEGEAGVSEFFSKNPNLIKRGGGKLDGQGGARVSDFFFQRIQI